MRPLLEGKSTVRSLREYLGGSAQVAERVQINFVFHDRLLRLVFIAALALAALYFTPPHGKLWPAAPPAAAQRAPTPREAFETKRSGVWLRFRGAVVRILKDDLKGIRHQRFIVRLPDGLTLLISHNIDLAARIPLRKGGAAGGFGLYEWNPKGGLVHWTHRDPRKKIPGGWIRYEGKLYR